MPDSYFTWIPFYEELATNLLEFKDDRPALIAKVQAVCSAADINPKLDSQPLPADMDPFTVFGIFNKGLTDINRKKIAAALAEEFNVSSAIPEDFDGVPLMNNLNATFYAFSDDFHRKEHDVDNLWRVFDAELALAADENEDTRAEFTETFDATVGQFSLGWKLTMGLYWMRPLRFFSLDSRNRWYVGDMAAAGPAIAAVVPGEKSSKIPDGRDCLAICDTVRSQLGSEDCPYEHIPALSFAAWVDSENANKEIKAAEKEAEENAPKATDAKTIRYWLYAPGRSASMWESFYKRGVLGLGWSELGDLREYATKEDMKLRHQEIYGEETSQNNSALATWQFVHDVKPGDVIFVKQGRTKILGRGQVLGDYEYDAAAGRYPHLRHVKWTHKGHWTIDEQFAMKTLTDVTEYSDFVGKICTCFSTTPEKPIKEELPAQTSEDDVEAETVSGLAPYDRERFLSEVYMDDAQYHALTGVLRSKKNVVLQGAPGVGKTFVAKRLAYSMMGVEDSERVMMVQFHQSYSYEDFVEGYRPSADEFILEKGAFYTFCKKAQDDEDNDYFFIIDEINRGNLSKIFGELFMLIESDKRGPRNKLQLLYSDDFFYVPSNVHIIGTMNTADRSLALLDYALRRRFAFFDLRPAFGSDGFNAYREELGSKKLNGLIACVVKLNDAIANDDSLGEGFCIGHSYFCGFRSSDVTDEKLGAIVEYELIPMLREYWFDDSAKVREWADALRKSIK